MKVFQKDNKWGIQISVGIIFIYGALHLFLAQEGSSATSTSTFTLQVPKQVVTSVSLKVQLAIKGKRQEGTRCSLFCRPLCTSQPPTPLPQPSALVSAHPCWNFLCRLKESYSRNLKVNQWIHFFFYKRNIVICFCWFYNAEYYASGTWWVQGVLMDWLNV